MSNTTQSQKCTPSELLKRIHELPKETKIKVSMIYEYTPDEITVAMVEHWQRYEAKITEE